MESVINNNLKKFIAALSIIGVVMAGYFLWARPYQLSWGATDEETQRPMPGDELERNPAFLATRAITINALPEVIWPWLVQMGFNRAGFYGYDIMEGLGSKRGMHSADIILPEFQNISVGDKVPISIVAETKFYAIEPNKYLIWAENEEGKPTGGFTWELYPVDINHTRLISRIRWSHHWTNPGLLSLDLLTEFTDHIALRRILTGIKVRAEGKEITSMTVQSIAFFFYLVTLFSFLLTIFLLLLNPLTTTSCLICIGAGIFWLITWYSPLLT